MGSKYDSVLKEKKKYEDVVDDRHFLRRHALGIDILIVIIILIISFIVYFFTILSPSKMVYDDVVDFLNFIDVMYENIIIDYDFNEKYNFTGNMNVSLDSNYDNQEDILFLNDLNFEYSVIDNGVDRSLNINGDKYSFEYYENDKNGYLTYGNNYIQYDLLTSSYYTKDYKNALEKIGDFFYQEIEKLEWKKSAFVSDEKLVVSLDLTLDGAYVNEVYSRVIDELEKEGRVLPKFLKLDKLVSDSAKYQINIKNDLFRNDLINLKVIINDGDYRGVFNYSGDTFTYSDDVNEYKCVLKIENNDFSLRFYSRDVMKYILSGSGNDNSYIYTYQVINVVDNMSLQIKKDNGINNYTLNIKKENDDKYFNLLISGNLNYDNYSDIDRNVNYDNFVLYSNLNEIEKEKVDNYVYRLYNSLSGLFNFVK